MITLFQFPPSFGLPVSTSQFCTKVEIYFRLTGREYRTEIGDPRKSPNKSVPYVLWPDGQRQAESDDIIARLEAEGPTLNQGLCDEDRAHGLEIQKLAENALYYACLFTRFVTEEGWALQRPTIKLLVPRILFHPLAWIIRRSQIKRCARNGYPDASGYATGLAAIERIQKVLGDRPFLLGAEPRTADCGVWACLLHGAATPCADPVRDAIRERPTLMAYIHRLAERAELSLPDFA